MGLGPSVSHQLGVTGAEREMHGELLRRVQQQQQQARGRKITSSKNFMTTTTKVSLIQFVNRVKSRL